MLRNTGIITEGEYEKKLLEEAIKYAEEGGFTTRVVEIDGVPKMLDELTIFANDGKQVYHKSNQPASGSINISECNLSQGIYYLQAITNNSVVAQKFIVR